MAGNENIKALGSASVSISNACLPDIGISFEQNQMNMCSSDALLSGLRLCCRPRLFCACLLVCLHCSLGCLFDCLSCLVCLFCLLSFACLVCWSCLFCLVLCVLFVWFVRFELLGLFGLFRVFGVWVCYVVRLKLDFVCLLPCVYVYVYVCVCACVFSCYVCVPA